MPFGLQVPKEQFAGVHSAMKKLLILSDIHANWPALEAVLRAEPNYDQIAFCGDVVDYGPHPVECVRWMANHVDYVVRGNHDNALAFDLDCQCMGSFREYSVATRAWHRTLLGEADIKFLAGMPTLNWFEWHGKHFRMAHATPQGDLFEYLPAFEWGNRIAGLVADYFLIGHTHIQGSRAFGRRVVVNPGSVGLARDEPGLACFAVYDGTTVSLKRVAYDVERTIADLRRAPLAPHVIDGLIQRLAPEGPGQSMVHLGS
jgi:putative phosphoesterase